MAELTNRQAALHEATALYAAGVPTHGHPTHRRVLDLAAAFEEWLNRDDSEAT